MTWTGIFDCWTNNWSGCKYGDLFGTKNGNKFLEKIEIRETTGIKYKYHGGKATEEEQLNRQRAHEHTKMFGGVLLVWIFLVWNIVQITQNHTNHRFDVDKN